MPCAEIRFASVVVDVIAKDFASALFHPSSKWTNTVHHPRPNESHDVRAEVVSICSWIHQSGFGSRRTSANGPQMRYPHAPRRPGSVQNRSPPTGQLGAG